MIDIITESALDTYYEEHCLQAINKARSGYFHIINHLKKHFGTLATNAITKTDVYLYCQKRREGIIGKAASDGTLNRELTVLLTAIRFTAVKLGVPLKDAVPEIISVFPRPAKGKKPWLTLPEMDKMLEVTKNEFGDMSRIHRFCMMGFYTGQRKEAILQLQCSQVYLPGALIDFNPPGRAQTRKRRPIVPIADELLPLVEKVVKSGAEYYCGTGSIRSTFELVVKKCAFEKRVTPHIMRHTYATQALQNGVSIWDVAGVLGDDPKTVQEYYGHHCPGHLRNAVNFRSKL